MESLIFPLGQTFWSRVCVMYKSPTWEFVNLLMAGGGERDTEVHRRINHQNVGGREPL